MRAEDVIAFALIMELVHGRVATLRALAAHIAILADEAERAERPLELISGRALGAIMRHVAR